MPFQPFHEIFPEIAAIEIRAVTILKENDIVPKGSYGFVEMFCNDKNCNCKRVIFNVLDEIGNSMALIGFGWGDKKHYDKWMRRKITESMFKELIGPCHYDGQRPSQHADFFLDFFKNTLLNDIKYIERVKRHYLMFKNYIDHGLKNKSKFN